MLFNSTEFLFLFLPLSLLLFYGMARWSTQAALGSLTLASLFFYAWWDWHFLPVLLVSMVFNFLLGKLLQRDTAYRGYLLAAAVTVNLSALFLYKYLDFAIASLNASLGTSLPTQSLALPLGISFFTFTQLAYLVDVYYRKAKESRVVDYVLFVTYFPHLIAGPILHHAQMMPQFRSPAIYAPRADAIACGLTFLTIGLIKKVLIADYLAGYATPVFDASSSGASPGFAEAWVGTLAYTLQLYFDFSGYCDMAIGISRLFNIDLPLNFASPYKADSISEFWRRWHMTLSQFLRDYLYIPLGGNRFGRARRYLNLFLTMLLGGLWHGANWTFVIWGALHGAYLIVNHGFTAIRERLGLPPLPRPLAIGITLIAVVLAWVPFRADSLATTLNLWQAMLGFYGMDPTQISDIPVAKATRAIAVGLLIVILAPNSQTLVTGLQTRLRDITATHPARAGWVLPGLLVGALFSITVMSLDRVSEFLYFQF